ncbi:MULTISPECIES: MobC family plasmid mobilization relaxosome protein [unclassified Kitasatospora]|uniref:MobC family plasmid mobilization relaxosome protein n=1 Tax=unclassified Kitasatospora TaxID=2633591 RepID=UPI0024740F51|nr:MobC family plasmid mobilization relaxosome protein [Kitasatospora sp. GAS204B]
MAETAQREGAPGLEVAAVGGHDPDKLLTVQQEVLAPVRQSDSADDDSSAAEHVEQSAHRSNRRFNGVNREKRVGPLQFRPEERAHLDISAAANGYRSPGGFAADVTLAFIDGRFFVDLPLAEERRKLHHFRTQVIRALNRIGNNVNQIAHALNGGYEPPVDARQTLDELHRLLAEIAEAVRQPADQEA